MLAIAVWVYSLWGYLTGQYLPQGDAAPYFGHINYYTYQLSRGVYPMWDPSRDLGVPNEFYLRRIGSFNPFYWLIVLMIKIGVNFDTAHAMFLGLYYVIGAFGFYELSRIMWEKKGIAFIAYLLFLFSSLSTLLFSSFIILIITPIIWFYYFFLSFARCPSRRDLLGMVFAVMLLACTYVPFYFLSMLLLSLILWACIYYSESLKAAVRAIHFFRDNKWFVCFCALAVAVSLAPGILFYIEAGRGEVVMNIRHKLSEDENILAVAQQNYIDGGILVKTLLYELTDNLKNFQLGQCYVPFAAHLFFLMGMFSALNRKILFMALISFFFFLAGLYEATPLYAFLYEHVFFVKYMRNFQYFLWLILVPCYILLASEHLCQWSAASQSQKRTKWGQWIMLFLSHGFMFFFLAGRQDALWSSYLLTGASVAFFAVCLWLNWTEDFKYLKKTAALLVVFLLIAGQSVEVFGYLKKSAAPKDPLINDTPNLTLVLAKDEFKPERLAFDSKEEYHNRTWFSVKWTEILKENVSSGTVNSSFSYKLAVYDRIKFLPQELKNFSEVEKSLWENQNLAFVSEPADMPMGWGNDLTPFLEKSETSAIKEIITERSEKVRVRLFDSNLVKLETNFISPKFLVYHDSFHKDWRAFVDGNQVPIYRSFIAFKGVALPSGKHELVFKFGYWWQRFLNGGLNVLYLSVFVLLIGYSIKKVSAEELGES